MDSDSYLDVVAIGGASGSAGSNQLLLWLSGGSSNLTQGECNSAPDRFVGVDSSTLVIDVAARDVSGDDVDDVVVVHANGSVVVWQRDDGGGSAIYSTTVAHADVAGVALLSSNRSRSVAVFDVDANGVLDVVYGQLDGVITILQHWNGSSGAHQREAVYSRFSLAAGIDVTSMRTADFNGDGVLDIVACCGAAAAGRHPVALIGNGRGSFVAASFGMDAGDVSDICISDLNNDDAVDVFACVADGSSSLVYINSGAGFFTDVGATTGLAVQCSRCSIGDFDMDGDADVLVALPGGGSRLYASNGAGALSWSRVSVGVVVSALSRPYLGAAMVDVDGDGDLDIPSLMFTSALSQDVRDRGMRIRLLDRAGHMTLVGARVCVQQLFPANFVVCRVVGGESSSYDVHLSVADATAEHSLRVVLPGGRVHDGSSQQRLSRVISGGLTDDDRDGVRRPPRFVIRDVPYVASLTLSPSSGLASPGMNVTLTVAAAGLDDVYLVSPCLMNGVDVWSSAVRVSTGVLNLTYAVTEDSADVAPGRFPVSLSVADARYPDAVSDVAQRVSTNTLIIDGRYPNVTLLRHSGCDLRSNGTVVGSASITVCVSCGSVVEEPFGCAMSYELVGSSAGGGSVVGSGVVSVMSFEASRASSNRVNFTVGPFATGDSLTLRLWATDVAGKTTAVTWVWLVDTDSPRTVWTRTPAMFDRTATPEFQFIGSKPGLRFEYSLDGAAFVSMGDATASGGDSGGDSNGSSSSVANVDTKVVVVNEYWGGAVSVGESDPHRRRTGVLAIRVAALLAAANGSSSIVHIPRREDGSNVTVQLRTSANTVWRDVRFVTGYANDGLVFLNSSFMPLIGAAVSSVGEGDGMKWVECRGVNAQGVADATPWVHVWTQDGRAPVVEVIAGPSDTAASDWNGGGASSSSDAVDAVDALVRCLDGAGDASACVFQHRVMVWQHHLAWVDASNVSLVGGSCTAAATNSSSSASSTGNSSWSTCRYATLRLSGLAANATYRWDVRAVDALGLVGETVSRQWQNGGCVASLAAASSSVVHDVIGSVASSTQRVFTWHVDALAAPYGVEYRLDSAATWTRTRASFAVVTSSASAWHVFEVRHLVPECCLIGAIASSSARPSVSVTYFEPVVYGGGVGVASFATQPASISTSVFGDFVFNNTAGSARSAYSLDNSSWADCGEQLRVGPLSIGPHSLTVQSAASSVGMSVSDAHARGLTSAATCSWVVSAASDSVLTLPLLSEGPHELTVVAVDRLSRREVDPRSYVWVVDTQPPVTNATLASPSVTRFAAVSVAVSCGSGESYPSLCFVCWSEDEGAVVAAGLTATSMTDEVACSLNSTLRLPSTLTASSADGLRVLFISGHDAAGNTDVTPVQVLWQLDTRPPNTAAFVSSMQPLATVSGATAGGIAVQNATNSSTVLLDLSADEIVVAYRVNVTLMVSETTSRVLVSSREYAIAASASSVLSIGPLPDGALWFTVSAVDVAGNVDVTSSEFRLLVDTVPPLTIATLRSRPISNSTAVEVQLAALGETDITASMRGFVVDLLRASSASSPPALLWSRMLGTQSEVDRCGGVGNCGNDTSFVNLTLSSVDSGRYTLMSRGVDAAGNVEVGMSSTSFIVDVDPPTTWLSLLPLYTTTGFAIVEAFGNDSLTTVTLFLRKNGGVWFTVDRRNVFTDLVDGVHVWELYGVDAAGNVQTAGRASVSTTVDTTPPQVSSLPSMLLYSNSTTRRVCFRVLDASPVTVAASGAGIRVPGDIDGAGEGGGAVALTGGETVAMSGTGNVTSCWMATMSGDGNVSIAVSATDAARNPSAALTWWTVLDRHPPSHRVVVSAACSAVAPFTAPGVETPIVCPAGGIVSAFHVPCHSNAGLEGIGSGANVAPCFVQWRMVTLTSSGSVCVDDNIVGVDSSNGDAVSIVAGGQMLAVGDAVVVPVAAADGQYRLYTRSWDAAGNAGEVLNTTWWIDTLPPSNPPRFTRTPAASTLSSDALFELQGLDDGSPGHVSYWYQHFTDGVLASTRSSVSDNYTAVGVAVASPATIVQLRLSGLALGLSHVVYVVARDQLGRQSSRAAIFSWRTIRSVPGVVIVSHPANVSSLRRARFVFAAAESDGLDESQPMSFEVSVLGASGNASQWHDVCSTAANLTACLSTCTGTRCTYTVELVDTRVYTLQVRAMFDGEGGNAAVMTWEHKLCTADEYAVLTDGDAIRCEVCPRGGDCTPRSPFAVVEQRDIVAQAGWWASDASDGLKYYRCPLAGSCKAGASGNGSRAVCETGYAHVACSLCADGYFEQFGRCVACPSSSGSNAGAMAGILLALIVAIGVAVVIRDLLPVDVIKLGVSMVQIIASANSAYDIPWPSAFGDFLLSLRVALIDIVAISRSNCAQPMDFYASLLLVCVGLKVVVAVVAVAPWLWRSYAAPRIARSRLHARWRSLLASTTSSTASQTYWSGVFKASFMVLFIAYPGVSLKVLRVFRCREIEGVSWLAADMRLRCYDSRWSGYAVYCVVMIAVYVVGFPATILWILWQRRHKLFGAPTDRLVASTRATYGFLYEDYGASAWWWEVEELLRKLFLSAVVVLIDEGSPLQVTLAVLVSGWAHVLHAMYKPWGVGSVLYGLQHGALFVTSFVFLMGLLFKVQGVSSNSGTFEALSTIMLLLCAAFLVAWLASVFRGIFVTWRRKRAPVRQSVVIKLSPDVTDLDLIPSSLSTRNKTAAAAERSASELPVDSAFIANPLYRRDDADSCASAKPGAGINRRASVVAAMLSYSSVPSASTGMAPVQSRRVNCSGEDAVGKE
jgi:hypothetical protein